jgi:hypothetical protein
MKRKPMLTKREKKTLEPARAPRAPKAAAASATAGPEEHQHQHEHIHCVSCGRHIDPSELEGTPPKSVILACQHGSRFASCMGCIDASQSLLDEHDRLNLPVKSASAWH